MMSNYLTKKSILIASICIVLAIASVLIHKYLFGSLRVIIEIKSAKNIVLQVFYDTGKGHNGDECKTIKINANNNFQAVMADFPSKSVKSLRIDPAIEPVTVFIKSITLEGFSHRHTWSAMDIARDFSPQRDIMEFQVIHDSIRINASGYDPQFVSVRPIPDVRKVSRIIQISLLMNLIMVLILIHMIVPGFIDRKGRAQGPWIRMKGRIKERAQPPALRYGVYGMKGLVILFLIYLLMNRYLIDSSQSIVSSHDLLDGGWQYALSRLTELNLVMGRDIFFTYGPLAGYLPQVIIPGNLEQQYLLHLRYMIAVALLYLFNILIFIKILRIHFYYGVIGGIVFLLNPFHHGMNDVTILASIGILSLLSYESLMLRNMNGSMDQENVALKRRFKSFFFLSLLSIFSATAFLFKISLGFSGILSIFLLILISSRGKSILFLKYSLVSAILLFLTLFGSYMALTSGTANFFKFIQHSYDISRLYSQMMAVPPPSIWPIFFAIALMFGLTYSFIQFRESRFPILILGPTLFLAFKAGFVRCDNHFLIFLGSVPLILILVPIVLRSSHPSFKLFWILMIGTFVVGLAFINKLYIGKVVFNPASGHTILSTYLKNGIKGYVGNKMRESEVNLKMISDQLDVGIKNAARGYDLAVIPWALTIPDAIGAHPLFYPGLQFYASYTERLDRANLMYFQALTKDDHILLEFKSIDGRYPIHDSPRTYEWILANYRMRENSKNYMLLEMKPITTDVVCEEPIQIGSGTSIHLKELGFTGENITAGKIGFKRLMVKNLVGIQYALRSLLLRAPTTHIKLELSSGDTHKYRTFPEVLERGIWLSPHIRNSNDIARWVSGDIQAVPEVLKVSIGQDTMTLNYLNEKPDIYLQECYYGGPN